VSEMIGVCCYTGWYVGTECNSDRTVVNIATGQLLCERDDGVCCYTGWYVGTECNSDTTQEMPICRLKLKI
jgi:hypothetical protein